MPPLVVIVGETASGKSALSMDLARKFNGEIICADSWTVYKGFDIGTAKPSADERAEVPHHLLDVADPRDGFSAPLFQRLAGQAITDITSRKRLPIMVGGTGLYIDSVLYDYSFLPATNPARRAELSAMSLPELLTLCDTLGLDMSHVDTRNKRRIVRHIENGGTRATRSALRSNTLMLGLATDRSELRERVAQRVDVMLAAGLEREVHDLAAEYGWEVEPMKGIGYREWREYFSPDHVPGELQNLHKTRERIIKSTMDLAKRQRTWFKRNDSIQWLTDRSYTADIVTTFLNTED